MPRALVTGGAGFIGSHLVAALLCEGWEVRVLDNFSSGRRANLEDLSGKLEVIVGDVSDIEVCRKAVARVEVVYHQAAIASVPRSVADPVGTHAVNLTGTVNLATEARSAGVRRLVFASSSAIYGNDPELPKRETLPPAPASPYAAQKLAGEYYLRVFSGLGPLAECPLPARSPKKCPINTRARLPGCNGGLETVALRYFNVFGPRQDPASDYAAVIPKFITLMLQGKAPTIFGDGRQSRDFIFVKDVVRGNLLAGKVPVANGRVVNLAGGKSLNLLDLVAALNGVLETNLAPVFAPPQAGDVRDSLADVGLAKDILGFVPEVSFADGLRETVAWYRRNMEQNGSRGVR